MYVLLCFLASQVFSSIIPGQWTLHWLPFFLCMTVQLFYKVFFYLSDKLIALKSCHGVYFWWIVNNTSGLRKQILWIGHYNWDTIRQMENSGPSKIVLGNGQPWNTKYQSKAPTCGGLGWDAGGGASTSFCSISSYSRDVMRMEILRI